MEMHQAAEVYQTALVQGGALVLLIAAGAITIRTLWRDLKDERKRNADYGERVLTALGQATAAIQSDTEAKRGLIERFDRQQVRP